MGAGRKGGSDVQLRQREKTLFKDYNRKTKERVSTVYAQRYPLKFSSLKN